MKLLPRQSAPRALPRAFPLLLCVVAFFTGCEQEKPATDPVEALTTSDHSSVPNEEVFQTVCAQCHGTHGEGKLELRAPSIAGFPEWYVVEQSAKFRSGMRGYHEEDIFGLQMRAIVLTMSEEQIQSAAKHIANLEPILTELPDSVSPKEIERGRDMYANHCMECHRYNGKGEIVFRSAPLITLNREYLLDAMVRFKKGQRGTAEGDLYGAKMVAATKDLSEEQITTLVNYIGALAHGDDPRPALEK